MGGTGIPGDGPSHLARRGAWPGPQGAGPCLAVGRERLLPQEQPWGSWLGTVCPGQSAACCCPRLAAALRSPALRLSASSAAGFYCMRAAAFRSYFSKSSGLVWQCQGSTISCKLFPGLCCLVHLKSQFNCLDCFNLYTCAHAW